MTDEGKEADLPPGDPAPEAVATHGKTTSRTLGQTGREQKIEDGKSDDPDAAGRRSLSAHTRDRLALQLRSMYDTIVQQPVPDRFAELIAKLEATDRS